MLDYLLNRWTIARRFEKADSGYIYRRRSDLSAFLVTAQEREDLLREFRRRYWKFWLHIFAGMLAGAAFLAIVAIVFELGESFLELASYALVAVLLAFIVWEQRKWSLLPERHFANCPQIEPKLSSASRLDRFHNMMRNRSWINHIALVLINGTLAWLFSFDLPEAEIGQWVLLIAFTASVLISLYGAAYKASSMVGS